MISIFSFSEFQLFLNLASANFPAHNRRRGTLYYGDNLDILKRYIKDETIDLVYLDPPFNSAQNYNAFFHEKDGTDAASQIHAFEDTWHWDIETKKAYDAVTEQPGKVSDVMQAFYTFLGGNDMMAYSSAQFTSQRTPRLPDAKARCVARAYHFGEHQSGRPRVGSFLRLRHDD